MTELNAGPELDCLIAEKVWSLRHEATLSINGRFSWAKNDGWWIAARDESCWERFRPSTSIAHAWEVVERLRALGFDLGVTVYTTAQYRCCAEGSNKYIAEHADTAPLAICRTALKALATS